MATVSGYDGTITLPGSTTIEAELQAWTLSETIDTWKAIVKGQGYKETQTGAKDYTGTATFLIGTDVATSDLNSLVGSTGSATFTLQSGDEYSGAITVTGQDSESPVDGPAQVTLTFESNGTSGVSFSAT